MIRVTVKSSAEIDSVIVTDGEAIVVAFHKRPSERMYDVTGTDEYGTHASQADLEAIIGGLHMRDSAGSWRG